MFDSFCESCTKYSTADDCNYAGLPAAGTADCIDRCIKSKQGNNIPRRVIVLFSGIFLSHIYPNIYSMNIFLACDVSNEFSCNNGNCIDISKRCDLVKNCKDNSDEENCQIVRIPNGYQTDNVPRPPIGGLERPACHVERWKRSPRAHAHWDDLTLMGYRIHPS